jgi:hypothetical protein
VSRRRLLFLGGNGHCAARLQPARDALAAAGGTFELVEIEVPGFDGRERAHTLDGLLAAIAPQMEGGALVYATGIGGLLALAVRARTPAPPLLLQSPVLWGLERRWMPRLLRLPPLRAAAGRLFGVAAFQRRFWRRHVGLPWTHAARPAFFDGYARCGAFADLFRWIGPPWLRALEAALRARPEALTNVGVWWGGRDTVVGSDELRLTEGVLQVRWPLREFADWGHYPMLTDPAGWVAALSEEPPLRASPR